MSNYSQKLKDPRWQKKRLEILQRDDFTCQKCKSENKALHVHHKYYLFDNEPWDYHPDILITYCFECHEDEEFMKSVHSELPKIILINGYTNADMCALADVIARNPDCLRDFLDNHKVKN